MRRPFRPLRSRLFRRLASWLVVATLLGNGLLFSPSLLAAPTSKDCCAEMMGASHPHHASADDCGHGKPCPAPAANCDDSCLARASTTMTLTVSAIIWIATAPRSAQPAHAAAPARPTLDFGPGLRPPISA